MTEREKICILCGKKERMLGYICMACQDRIQTEAVDSRQSMRLEANCDYHGDDPDDEHKKLG